MDSKSYTVTWEPGAFGHFLQSIIIIQNYKLDIQQVESHSHLLPPYKNNLINIVHPYDSKLVAEANNIIKPYFANNNLRFFPKYLNYIKYGQSQKPIELLKLYWNYKDLACEKSFNIDMTNLFTNLNLFLKDIEDYLNEKLSRNTIAFINQKRSTNLIHFTNFNEKILHTSSCCQSKTFKEIVGTDYEIGLILCDYFQDDVVNVNKFIQNYDGKQILNTTDIIKYENQY